MSDNPAETDEFSELGERRYFVTEVVKTRRPKGIQSGEWFRYTIGHESSPISGVRAGSLESVRRYAEEFTENLNQRALTGRSTYSAKRPQQK